MKLKRVLKNLVCLAVLIGPWCAHAGSYDDFFTAIIRDNAPAVRRLLLRGFDPNTRDEKGQVGLYLALRDGSFEVADTLLLQPDLDVNAANAAGETPLMMAALHGQTDWEAKLIARGAKTHQEGWSPVLYAASGPQPKALELLLDRGAPPNARSPNGTTPLMMAARYGPEESVKLLLARGADPRLRNDQRLNAADFARLGGRDALSQQLAALTH